MNTITELDKIPKSEWPEIYCSLNRWIIPNQLIHLRPNWWPYILHYDNFSDVKTFIDPLMEHIKNHIPDKVLSREWNKDTMSDEQHERWYNLSENEKLNFNATDNHNPIP